MEDTDTAPQSTDSAVNKKRATPTSSLPTSSPDNGSSNKRQRLDSKKPAGKKSPADFISLDFSEGEGGGEEDSEAITQISKSASVDAIAEENGDAEEEELKEKTLKRKKRLRTRKRRKDKELDAQGARVGEKPGQFNSTGRNDSSSEENEIRISPKDGNSDPKDAENESEEEESDKDSSTRRALQAKMTNSAQIPEESEVERNLNPVEIAAVTAAKSETDNANSSNSSSLAIEDPGDVKSVAEDGAEISARQKIKEEKKEKKRREKDKQRKAARKERKAKTQLDLPRGGDFSNLEMPDIIGISSDENDEGLEINLEMDIDDLGKQQGGQLDKKQAGLQAKNQSGDEEGEVDENGDGANKKEIVPSQDDSDDGNDSPLLDQATAVQQRKYYTAFALPPFEHEEARPYFASVKNPDFEIDLVREKKLATPHKIKEKKRICNVCTKTGHTEDECELIKV